MASKITIINLVQVPLRLVWSSWANPNTLPMGTLHPHIGAAPLPLAV